MVGSFSAIQPPFDINSPCSFGYIRKLAIEFPYGNYFTTFFVCTQHKAPRSIRLTETILLLGRVEPRRFFSCALINSCQASVGFEPGFIWSSIECTTTGLMCPSVCVFYIYYDNFIVEYRCTSLFYWHNYFFLFLWYIGGWLHWLHRVEEYVYASDHVPEFSSILVPNVDNVRTNFLIDTIAKQYKVLSLEFFFLWICL